MARIVIEEPCKTCEGTGSVSGWPDTPWERCPTCRDDNGVRRRVLDPGSYVLIEKREVLPHVSEWPDKVLLALEGKHWTGIAEVLDALAGGEQP